MAANEPLRIGVLGCAGIAQRAFIPAMEQVKGAKLVAVASRDIEKAKAQVAKQKAKDVAAHGSYEALLADPNVDAVYIPLPNGLHPEWTAKAAKAGKHVLCEKPLAATAAQCREMIAACREANVVLMEAFMYRYHPLTLAVKRLLTEGRIGKVRLVRAGFSFPLTDRGNVRVSQPLQGGCLMDVGCYAVNASRYFAGEEPIEAFCFADVWAESGVDESLAGLLRFPSGAVGMVDSSFHMPGRGPLEIVGEAGRILVSRAWSPGAGTVSFEVEAGGKTEKVELQGGAPFAIETDHFAACVREGTTPMTPGEEGLRNALAMEALLESAKTKRPAKVGPE